MERATPELHIHHHARFDQSAGILDRLVAERVVCANFEIRARQPGQISGAGWRRIRANIVRPSPVAEKC
jgi:hypothetical protein